MSDLRVNLELDDDLRFTAHDEAGAEITLESPPVAGGGMSPMELLLASAGACSAMDVISILRKKRQDVTGYRIEVEGTRAEEHPKAFTAIHIRHIVTGNSISEQALSHSIELSQEKYCSVLASLDKAVRISSSFEILPAHT